MCIQLSKPTPEQIEKTLHTASLIKRVLMSKHFFFVSKQEIVAERLAASTPSEITAAERMRLLRERIRSRSGGVC